MALEVSVQKGSKFVPALSGEKKKVRKSLTCRKLLLLTSVLKEQFDMPSSEQSHPRSLVERIEHTKACQKDSIKICVALFKAVFCWIRKDTQ